MEVLTGLWRTCPLIFSRYMRRITFQSAEGNRDSRELYPDLTRAVSEAINMEVEELEEETEDYF